LTDHVIAVLISSNTFATESTAVMPFEHVRDKLHFISWTF